MMAAAQRHLGLANWGEALCAVCSVLGLPGPQPGGLDLLPLCGADSVVFLVGDVAVKFLAHEVGGLVG